MSIYRWRCSLLSWYFIILAFYGAFMFMKTTQRTLIMEFYNDNQEMKDPALFLGDTKSSMTSDREQHTEDSNWLIRPADFYSHLLRPTTKCIKLIDLGGTFCKKAVDSNKMVCMDSDVGFQGQNCTVYSFGIGDDTTFDDLMHYYGCEVFMFDPTVRHKDMINLQPRQHFFPFGVGDAKLVTHVNMSYDDGTSARLQVELYPYAKIRKMIGHNGKRIHYFKMDIEGSEWRVIPDLVQDGHLEGVLQLAIEIHTEYILTLKDEKEQVGRLLWYWNILEQLEKAGFQRAHVRQNVVYNTLYVDPGTNTSYATCLELLYLRRPR